MLILTTASIQTKGPTTYCIEPEPRYRCLLRRLPQEVGKPGLLGEKPTSFNTVSDTTLLSDLLRLGGSVP
jgi:hypothetical protein